MAKVVEALGMIETKGFIALVEATDANDESGKRRIQVLGQNWCRFVYCVCHWRCCGC